MGMLLSHEENVQRLLDDGDTGEVRPERIAAQIQRYLRMHRVEDGAVTRTGDRLVIRMRGKTIRHTTRRKDEGRRLADRKARAKRVSE